MTIEKTGRRRGARERQQPTQSTTGSSMKDNSTKYSPRTTLSSFELQVSSAQGPLCPRSSYRSLSIGVAVHEGGSIELNLCERETLKSGVPEREQWTVRGHWNAELTLQSILSILVDVHAQRWDGSSSSRSSPKKTTASLLPAFASLSPSTRRWPSTLNPPRSVRNARGRTT
jgi:hypothetical protein